MRKFLQIVAITAITVCFCACSSTAENNAVAKHRKIGVQMYTFHKKTLEESFAFGEKSAPTHMKKTYIFRISIVGILMILAAWSGWFNILALLLGIMNLKIAVYLQPILNTIFR